MSDIIKKIKKYISKECKHDSVTRNSYGENYDYLLFCYTSNKKYYSSLVKYDTLREESIQIISTEKKLFNESLFRGEYYNGVFYITSIINSSFDPKHIDLENLKYMPKNDACYTYSFDSNTFEEKWVKNNGGENTMVVIKDVNLIEIYKEKKSGKILRVKNTATSKRLSNLFYASSEIELEVIFNTRFDKWEIV